MLNGVNIQVFFNTESFNERVPHFKLWLYATMNSKGISDLSTDLISYDLYSAPVYLWKKFIIFAFQRYGIFLVTLNEWVWL